MSSDKDVAVLPIRKIVGDGKGSAVDADVSQILHSIVTFDSKTIENLGLKAFVKNPEFLAFLDSYCEHLDRVGFYVWASDLRNLLKWLRINWSAEEGKLLSAVIDALKSIYAVIGMNEEIEDDSRRGRLGLGGRRDRR